MREERGDLFKHPADAIVIPVNWKTNRQGDAIMGAGVALAAKKRWPDLPTLLGHWIDKTGPHVFWERYSRKEPYIVFFPTKRDWRDPSDVGLIEAMGKGLVSHADHQPTWQTVALPRLGCGLGQLDWDVQVRPLLAGLLDDRFVVCHPNGR